MAFQIEYNDPTTVLEKFLTTVRGLWPKAAEKVGPLHGEWEAEVYTVFSQFGHRLHLNLMTPAEYAYIILTINDFNRDIPRRLY